MGGDTVYYIEAARDLGGPSRFPLGLPLLLAPISGSMLAMRVLMLAVTLGLLGAVWWAARLVGGWRGAAVAGVLLALVPAMWERSPVMSDRLGALLAVGGLIAVLEQRYVLAGVLTGLGGWVRLVHVVFVAALPRRSWVPAGVLVTALAVTQLVVKGSLLGYSTREASFALGNITGPTWLEMIGSPATVPNAIYFPAVLLAGFGGSAGGLVVGIAGPVGLWLNRGSEAARFAMGVIALSLVVYLPYRFQSARFMLAGIALLLVYAAAAIGGARGDTQESVAVAQVKPQRAAR